jgi:hypothetical protein
MLHPDMRERLGEDKVKQLSKPRHQHHSVTQATPAVERPARRRLGFVRRAAAALTPHAPLR